MSTPYHELPPVHPGAGRLGRHQRHDPRNDLYLYQASPAATIRSITWPRHGPIFDQGQLGSCTANAIIGAVQCDPLYNALPNGHPALTENYCVDVYEEETRTDPYPGQYPPDDTGSDGTTACQTAKHRGLISGYTHCTTLAGMLAALQTGPVIAGYDWWSSFDTPGLNATITINPGAYVRGGHETLIRGADTTRELLLADNSWGTSWGDSGSFRIPWTVMDRLLSAGGDCNVPLPANAPQPVPSYRITAPPPGIWVSDVTAAGTGTDGQPWHTVYTPASGWSRPTRT